MIMMTRLVSICFEVGDLNVFTEENGKPTWNKSSHYSPFNNGELNIFYLIVFGINYSMIS
jgi:hypothetical protein